MTWRCSASVYFRWAQRSPSGAGHAAVQEAAVAAAHASEPSGVAVGGDEAHGVVDRERFDGRLRRDGRRRDGRAQRDGRCSADQRATSAGASGGARDEQ